MVCSSCPFCCVDSFAEKRASVASSCPRYHECRSMAFRPVARMQSSSKASILLMRSMSFTAASAADLHVYQDCMYTITTNLLNRCRPRNSFARRLRIHSLPSYSNWIFNAYIAFAIQRALCIAPGFRMGA